MKAIMIVDGADNCAYDIFLASEELFHIIFPENEQNIEFIEDVCERNDASLLNDSFEEMWRNPVRKENVRGIDGILFYELQSKSKYYPTKKDSDLDYKGRGFSVAEIKKEDKI